MEIDTAYIESLENWRAEMDSSLRAPYSWLALAGLFWLQEGENPFGSAPENAIQLPPQAPAQAGIFHLQDGVVTVDLAPGVEASLNEGEAPPPGAVLHNDHDPLPDYLFLDDLRLLVILRGGQLAIRLWDPQNEVRQAFEGRRWYPPNPAYRVQARIEPYDPPKPVTIADMVGKQTPGQMDAALVFEIDSRECRLDAQRRPTGVYSITFKDATAGQGSYPAARFVSSERPQGDQVVLDFNRAYSPPCSFTAYATCPLPTPENVLEVKIEAGERYEG